MLAATAVSQTSYRPFLKWAGGKGRLLSQYAEHIPHRFTTYYEPFLGGGAVFFALADRLQAAVLADINEELVNVYQVVRDHVEDLIDLLQRHRQQHDPNYYYFIRSQTELACPIQRAARLIYLNKTCYNGLYRENSKGHFNVPIGRYKNPGICDPDLLRRASTALRRTWVHQQPFDFVLEQATATSDFVYFDPPYHPISATSSFTGYSRYGFTADDQIRLRDTFAKLADRGVKVMLSNSDCPFIRDLYADYSTYTIYASRAINSKAKRRGRITELLITSY